MLKAVAPEVGMEDIPMIDWAAAELARAKPKATENIVDKKVKY